MWLYLGTSIAPDANSLEFDGKIHEIRKVAKGAREIKGGEKMNWLK